MSMNTNLTGSGVLSSTMQTYYDRKLLMNAKPKLCHQQYGQKVLLPKNSGKAIQFRKWTPFPALLTALTEGVVPDGQSLSMTAITTDIEQYGGYVAVSDLLDMTALDPVINDSVELMGDQGGLSIDTLVRDVITASTNVQYAGGKTARHKLTFETGDMNRLTVDEIRKAVRTLKKNKAPQFVRNGKGYYIAIVGPDTTYDLQSDPLWQDVSKYAASENIFEGEIGKLFGVVFVETSEARVFSALELIAGASSLTVASYSNKVFTVNESISAGEASAMAGKSIILGSGVNAQVLTIQSANGPAKTITVVETPTGTPGSGDKIYAYGAGDKARSVAATLVFGKNAYGVVDLEGGNLRSIIKPKGSAGTADPLDQISTIGWKVDGFAAKVLQPLWLVRIEHTYSM